MFKSCGSKDSQHGFGRALDASFQRVNVDPRTVLGRHTSLERVEPVTDTGKYWQSKPKEKRLIDNLALEDEVPPPEAEAFLV